MERELLMTGIGGQGIQLAAQVLALAAVAEAREVMLFGSYGGMMRGGNTEATLVVADGPIAAPPTVGSTWSALVMHHDYWESTRDRLRDDSVVLLNSTVFAAPWQPAASQLVVRVPATEIAPAAASLALLGAYAAVTGLVRLESLIDVLPAALPVYRQHTVAANAAALRAGAAHCSTEVTTNLAPAWPVTCEAAP
jgi:Pyruvate/2-oxoacid:ferredoxin oxidoreductase gamma subunit